MPSPSPPRASWPSGDDNTAFNLIVILVGCVVGGYLLWTACHGEISAGVLALRHGEIGVIRYFTDHYDLADRQMLMADPESVTLSELYRISHAVGMFFRIPAALLILLLAVLCALWAPSARYRRAFDLDGLIREQAASFHTSAAFVRRHLRLVPPGFAGAGAPPGMPRPADYALTPEEWIARFATGRDGNFDAAIARQALIRQLGPRWRGLHKASPQISTLFAAFTLHLAARRDEALRLLGELSAGIPNRDQDKAEGPDTPLSLSAAVVAAADAVLRDSDLVTPALAIANRHAYAHTALMQLLSEARLRSGVLAPGQFAWLKFVDRPLWYALQSLGFEGVGRYLHPNPRVEGAGARDHWAVERITGRPVIEPSLDRAVAALGVTAALVARRARAGNEPQS